MNQIRVFSRFEELPVSYGDLFPAPGKGNFYLSRPWFENFAATCLSDGEELAIVGLEAQAVCGGVAALVGKRHRQRHGAFHLQALSALANFYSMDFAPLVASGERDTLKCLIKSMRQSLMPDVVSIGPIEHLAKDFTDFAEAFESCGFAVEASFRFGKWSEAVEGRSFEEYLRDRPSALKNTLRRRKRTVMRSASARFEIITDLAGLETAYEAYEAVYKASWKGRESFPAFMPGLLRTAATCGCLRLGIVYLDNVPAAAQVWLTSGGNATIYKLAYDERFKGLSVGSLLTEHMMRHSIDSDRVSDVDFGSGDDAYKKDWMTQRREWWDLRAYSMRTPRGLLAYMNSRGKAAARGAIECLRGLRPTAHLNGG